jgi:tryptophan-rich sensory protein
MSGSGVKSRFAELRQPRYAPQLWTWFLIGLAYYALFFVLLRSLLRRPPIGYWTDVALVLTASLLIANAGWNWIFFRRKDLFLSSIVFIPYLLLAVTLLVTLQHLQSPLSGWFALYVAYLGYAAWWTYRVWRLNSRPEANF